jgi:hypothetical protein
MASNRLTIFWNSGSSNWADFTQSASVATSVVAGVVVVMIGVVGLISVESGAASTLIVMEPSVATGSSVPVLSVCTWGLRSTAI